MLPSVLLIQGTDELKKQQALKKVIDAISPDFRDFNLEEFTYSTELEAQDVIASCVSIPFGDGQRLVILRFESLIRKEVADALAAYLDDPNEACCLCLVGIKLDKRQLLYKKIAQLGASHIMEFEEEKAYQVPQTVLKMAADLGLSLTLTQAQLIVKRSGTDTIYLNNLLQSLAKTAGDSCVTEQFLLDNVPWIADIKPWDITDAFSKRDLNQVVSLIVHLDQNAYIPVLVSVQKRIRELLVAKDCARMHKSIPQEIARVLHETGKDGKLRVEPDWKFKNHMSYARQFSEEELIKALKLSLTAERGLKGDASDKQTCMLDFMVQITQKHRG